MMMAHDSTPFPPALDEETMTEVRSALRQYVRDGSDPSALTHALRRMSDEARRREMRPEQLLVILKGIWGSLPEVRYSHRAEPHGTMLQKVISLCIEQYYGK
jgi:hypothetical protein